MIRRSVGFFVVLASFALSANGARAQAPAATPPATPAAPAGAAAPTGPAPHIKFDAVEVNLGDVVRGQDAVATYTYHNTGDAPLHILSAKPG
jgi:hypothetical protein